ncbi:MAG TPA: hypothetical protein VJ377_08715 [Dehalococcoidales bacterium]|nr:MAG: hypothetical protein A2Z05_07150 [Chloroflexi bacterium RBG_16_60_22]HJX13592.1 hypothetical protein [Dehalococcoidales bacterium]
MLCIVRPKACKRCGGDLSLECDIYGVYVECIQCGATWTRQDMVLTTRQGKGKQGEDTGVRPVKITGSRR